MQNGKYIQTVTSVDCDKCPPVPGVTRGEVNSFIHTQSHLSSIAIHLHPCAISNGGRRHLRLGEGGKRFVCMHKYMVGGSGGMFPQENFTN